MVLELVDDLALSQSMPAALSVPADKCLGCFRQAVTLRSTVGSTAKTAANRRHTWFELVDSAEVLAASCRR